MVLPPSSAPEGQARGRERWLKEIRRWLHLGHDGVLIAVRDAKPWGLRPLARLLAEVDHQRHLLLDAKELTTLEPGALALLIVRAEDLDWLNLNRPILAQQKLRVVLWVEEALGTPFKFQSPDLHDWVSHFVPCPDGVPDFALEGLRVGSTWWPGVAWTGPGLDLALEQLGLEAQTLEPMDNFEALVQSLSSSADAPFRWVGVDSLRALWRVRWAVATAQHRGLGVLDNPGMYAPGWFPVDSAQLHPEHASELLSAEHNTLELAITLECERRAVEEYPPNEGELEDDELLDVGLMRHPGPALRKHHGSPQVQTWRREMVKSLIRQPQLPWPRANLALYSSFARDSPNWAFGFSLRSEVLRMTTEYDLRRHSEAKLASNHGAAASTLLDYELMERWGLEEPMLESSLRLGSHTWLPPDGEYWEALSFDGALAFGENRGWDTPIALRAVSEATVQHLDDPQALLDFIHTALVGADRELGSEHPSVFELEWLEGLALALLDLPFAALERINELLERSRFQLSDAHVLELGAVEIMCSQYEQASERLRASSTDATQKQRHLYIAALMAAGAHPGSLPPAPDSKSERLDPQDLAREYLIERLRAR